MSDLEDLKWGEPINARRWHIFREGRSLCGGGRWMLLGADQSVSEDDSYREGKDCKECCRRAGLLEESG